MQIRTNAIFNDALKSAFFMQVFKALFLKSRWFRLNNVKREFARMQNITYKVYECECMQKDLLKLYTTAFSVCC